MKYFIVFYYYYFLKDFIRAQEEEDGKDMGKSKDDKERKIRKSRSRLCDEYRWSVEVLIWGCVYI